jgi:MFS family permease
MSASRLPRDVWRLGWVSLATDAASEAIYPLLPFFLTQVLGAGAISLGIVEGAAEAVNSLLKILSGRWADRAKAKRPIVLGGYALSSAIRPLMSLAQSWTDVFGIRFVDRVGKGIRGAPRDALLATLATPETRGRVYGFHRGMDHAGAVLGPALASAFLFFYPQQFRTLFALTIVPGVIAVALVLMVREPDAGVARRTEAPQPQTLSSPALTRFFIVLSVFTLGNSTDAFLLLKLTDAAGGVQFVPLMWAALHVVKAGVSFVGGGWSDRVGRRGVIGLGWSVYALVYVGFAFSVSLTALLAWFLLYGLYFGFAEGTEKALVADLAPASARGFAFGLYTAVQGLGSFAASLLFGALWSFFGPVAAFATGAALAVAATAALFVMVPARATYN